jgi:ParB family transcriptional regulator, chromosome partitioning protein
MNSGIMIDVAINSIKFSKNYRQTFQEKTLKELAQSIKQHGVIQPLVIRRVGEYYELIAGDRRLKAAELAGCVTVPCRIVEATDSEVLELQLIENVQRETVPYYEEALALKRLRDDPYNYDVREIAQKIGKSEQYVYFQLKLTKMCLEARRACEKGELSKGVAWLLSRIDDENMQAHAARDLRRENKSKLIGERAARKYLEDLKTSNNGNGHSPNGTRSRAAGYKPRKRLYQNAGGSEYQSNWKQYLLKFDAAQFAQFKEQVAGRTSTEIWADAVDIVMSGVESA